jgi:hypothetical protein
MNSVWRTLYYPVTQPVTGFFGHYRRFGVAAVNALSPVETDRGWIITGWAGDRNLSLAIYRRWWMEMPVCFDVVFLFMLCVPEIVGMRP